MTFMMKTLFFLTTLTFSVDAYWLMGAENVLTVQRLDPIVSGPGKISSHVHTIFGGSNFGTLSTAELRKSQCTSIPIAEDKSNYWVPQLYFQWKNGSVSSVDGGAVLYYLFPDPAGGVKAFPDDFRMISGNPYLRSRDPNSFAQQAITFLCLDFNGVTTKHNELPAKSCPSGVRAQINFPSCWDGKNVDSPDHKSHVAFLSEGPDKGSCKDPNYPVQLPRIFMELYWSSGSFDVHRGEAMNSSQPFVFANGDSTGYGYHGDFINGWDAGVLQKAVDNCHCNIYGDPHCCADAGIFTLRPGGQHCFITPTVNEQVKGTLPKLPGNNPVVGFGNNATPLPDNSNPGMLGPVYAYTGNAPTATPTVVTPAGAAPPASPTPQANVAAGKPGASPVKSPAPYGNVTPPSMPTPPTENAGSGQGPKPPAPPQNATLHHEPSPLTNPGPQHAPTPAGCDLAKTVFVTVTVTNTPQAGAHTPSPSHHDDEDCDEMTPSPTPTPHKNSRSIRARHNVGRRFMNLEGTF